MPHEGISHSITVRRTWPAVFSLCSYQNFQTENCM